MDSWCGGAGSLGAEVVGHVSVLQVYVLVGVGSEGGLQVEVGFGFGGGQGQVVEGGHSEGAGSVEVEMVE